MNVTCAISEQEQAKVRDFLHGLDGYGRNKLETEDLFYDLTNKFNTTHEGVC